MNWKQKLQEIGLSESQLSRSLKKKAADYETINAAIKEVSEALKEADEDEVEDLQNQLSELKEGLQESNNDLVRSIEIYIANKDANQARVEKMRAGKEAKKVNKALNPAPTPTPAAEPKPASQNNPADPISVQAQVIDENEGKEKKKSNALFWILGAAAAVIVGVVTLGRRAE